MQAVQAAQITFEDFFLSSMDISALKIVGFEGLWGSLAMFLVLLPIVQVAYHNLYPGWHSAFQRTPVLACCRAPPA